jgi:hypothetical protein
VLAHIEPMLKTVGHGEVDESPLQGVELVCPMAIVERVGLGNEGKDLPDEGLWIAFPHPELAYRFQDVPSSSNKEVVFHSFQPMQPAWSVEQSADNLLARRPLPASR